MLGALALPTLWVISQDALSVLLTNKPLLNSEEVTHLFAIGCLPGMVMGAGAVRAWVAWRDGRFGKARRLLIGYGGLISLVFGGLLINRLLDLTNQAEYLQPVKILSKPMPVWFHYVFAIADAVPLQVALAMFLMGLFMRGERA